MSLRERGATLPPNVAGEIPSVVRPCPVCGSQTAHFAFDVTAERLSPAPPSTHAYFECVGCESVFLTQLPSEEELRLFYESESYHYITSPVTTDTLLRRRLVALRRRHLHISRPLPSGAPGALLDFGCGRGDYLDYASWRGWRAVGVEYSESSAETARRRGFEVITEDSIEDLPDGSFLAISMIHSLEHHRHPAAILQLLASKLTDDGQIFIELPYLDCHEYRLFGRHYSMIQAPVHLQFFADRTIEHLAEQCGLKVVGTANNYWSPIYYVWSMLNLLESASGMSISRGTKNLLSALGFPITMWVARLAGNRSRPGAIRQYTLVKSEAAIPAAH